jgi:EAL domain-containing protein (putative c-di-GMP-specific phosphodiesterase class I)
MSEELRRGISEDQLVVWYQPQMDAATQHITGIEALVRWQHPTQGLMQPLHFLPDARRSGLMLALSEAVAHRVVNDARRWMDSGFDFRVAMNCAPPELMSGSLLPRLFESVDEAGLQPEMLLVEVTEDSFLSDPERAREMILELRENDIQVSIDDYGTGFSSLAYLRDLPVQELKMDRSFVATIRSDARSRVIVTSTMQMAHAMGLRMVAEGVEDAETAAELIAMGVDVLQGIHVARPMIAAEVGPWVRRWSAGLAAAPSNRARHFFD